MNQSIRERLDPRQAILRHPNLVFWLAFCTLNILLFLPLYLLTRTSSPSLLSILGQPGQLSGAMWARLLVWRNSPDPLRLNAELCLFVGIWLFTQRTPRRWYRILFTVFYFLALVYYIYEGIIFTFFQELPTFYADYFLITENIGYLHQNLNLSTRLLGSVLAGSLVGILLVVQLIRTMLAPSVLENLSGQSRLVGTMLVVLVGAGLLYGRDRTALPETAISSLFYKVGINVKESIEDFRYTHAADDEQLREAYDYADLYDHTDFEMQNLPNIYLLFVESYGSVLYQRPDWEQSYTELMAELNGDLANSGWHVASAMSQSPTWGGGSWLAYVSALFGTTIEDDPLYQRILREDIEHPYPHLIRFLKEQGYHTYRLTAVSVELDEQTQSQLESFFDVDRWLTFDDLSYTGIRYNWGAAAPDQYAMHAARDIIRKEAHEPFFLFTITQNSHYPWVPPPAIHEDWRTLNRQRGEDAWIDLDAIPHSLRRSNYYQSIEYDMRVLIDFIQSQGDENSLFVLVGDHQPPRVSRRDDTFNTPLHVISQNPDLVQALIPFGFTNGLTLDSVDATLDHAGIYSLVVHLLALSAESQRPVPAFLPHGVPLSTEPESKAVLTR